MIATVPGKSSISGEGSPYMNHVMSLQRAVAGFSSQTSAQGSSVCTKFSI